MDVCPRGCWKNVDDVLAGRQREVEFILKVHHTQKNYSLSD